MGAGSLSRLNREQIERLASQQSISEAHPWGTEVDAEVDEFYKGICEHLCQATGALSRIEWDHYGSGYASFIDAWFYKPTPDFKTSDRAVYGQAFQGLAVLLSRLSPYFVFMEGGQHWHPHGSSSYMPGLESVDEISSPAVLELAAQIQPLLESHGLQRLYRSELSTLLPAEIHVPTILNQGPLTEFDALFYWED